MVVAFIIVMIILIVSIIMCYLLEKRDKRIYAQNMRKAQYEEQVDIWKGRIERFKCDKSRKATLMVYMKDGNMYCLYMPYYKDDLYIDIDDKSFNITCCRQKYQPYTMVIIDFRNVTTINITY